MKEPLQNPNGTLRPPSEGFVPSDHTGPRRDRRGKAMKLACALFLVCAAVAWAQPPAQQTLPEVVVTASRIPVPALTAPAFTRVITANEIKNSSGASLGDLLRSTAGLHVSSDGPTGAVTSLSIRGATSSEVLVLLNGVPLNSSLDGSVDLSSIPTDSIARIEIVRGGESSVYGTGAIGGVVNIITKKADRQPSLDVSVENRSYLPHAADLVYPGMVAKPVPANPLDLLDSQKLSGSASGVLGKVGLAGVFGFTRAANAFVWKDSTYSNAWRKENHAGGLSGNGYLHLGIPTAVGEISSATSVVSSSFDVPGTLSGPGLTTTASQERTTAGETIGYASPSSTNGRAAARSKLYYRYERLHYADPATQPPTDSTTVTNSAGGYASGSYRFSDLLSLAYGASARYDGVKSSEVGDRSRVDLAGFASTTISPTDRLSLTPSVRYDYFSDVPSGFSYRLGAVFALSATSSLKGSLSDSYRVPTINDLFWPAGPYTQGNPHLKPETAVGGDFGYTLRDRHASLDASLFGRMVYNQIVWAPLGNPLTTPWTPQNLGRSFIPGAEINGSVRVHHHLTLSLASSFIYSFLLSDATSSLSFADNRRVPYVPLETLTASAAYARWGGRLALEAHYLSREFTDNANSPSTALPPHVVVNLSFRQKLGRGVVFSLAAKNLLNSVYETQVGYPMPPFSLWTGLSISR